MFLLMMTVIFFGHPVYAVACNSPTQSTSQHRTNEDAYFNYFV